MSEPLTANEREISIDLKDPAVAALLAWLIPGLGHLYQGRTAKGLLFFISIMTIFVYGVYLSSDKELGWGRAVYASWRPGDVRFYYVGQICVGVPALPAMVQASRVRGGKSPMDLWNGFMAPPPLVPTPGAGPTLDTLHNKLNVYFELGTLYTTVAGLLNVLAIYDAWGGPVFIEDKKKEEEEEEEKEPSDG